MNEIIEGHAERLDDKPIEINVGPSGPTPFFLVMEIDDGERIGVDLDSPWHTTHAEHLRKPATWWLIHKGTQKPAMAVVVQQGDQPYFSKHHVGELMSGRELIVYGMGKKQADGTMVRNWILPNGIVCGGDDVDIIGARMLAHS